MNKINLSKVMNKQAELLNEGGVLCAYKDENAIRMETKNGIYPYVWRNGQWRKMR